jgi:lipopolysaccharide transport system ATP-binding protein
MSDEVAIRLRGVSKSYTVYAKPRYWLAEFLGLGRLLREGRHYRSFWALRDIDLEVPRGAKVAIVGRNGAGKSTLLRIISDNVAPTLGTVEVHGRCEALMQLGAGFNPEFTGSECVRAALAYMGVTGKDAEERLADVLEFSELDEFIEQPVRTYSSGMYLRLAFSVATMIAPEILIIDEVLGAGDLYFQAKCLARIQGLASGPGTTVLFVSHDLEAAQRLCETFVWVDRGRIVARGPAAEVRAAYEDSVRRQQEARLRARNLRLGPRAAADLDRAGGLRLVGQLVLEEGGSEDGPAIEAIRLVVQGRLVETIRVGDAMDDASHYPSYVISDPSSSRWGPAVRAEERLARRVLADAGTVRGAKFVLQMPPHDLADGEGLEIEVLYRDLSRRPCRLELDARAAGLKRILSLEHAGDGVWKSVRAEVPRWIYTGSGAPVPSSAASGGTGIASERRFGTGQVSIERVRFRDQEDREVHIFRSSLPMTVEVDYLAHDTSVVGLPLVFALGFERLDGVMATTLISTAHGHELQAHPRGRLRARLEPLLLTRGEYRVSIVLFSRLDLEGGSAHFTRSPDLYDMHRLAYDIVVEGTPAMEIGLFRQPVRFENVASPDRT